MRERVRYLYGSLQTEKVYVYWANAFVLWAAQMGGVFAVRASWGGPRWRTF